MTTKHKWHKEIKAWAEGAEIESRYIGRDEELKEFKEWSYEEEGAWNADDWEFRIKPQPKEPLYAHAWLDIEEGRIEFHDEGAIGVSDDGVYRYLGKIKIEEEK